ncbi:MAG: hypothetical protein J6F30_13320, partial [Cellulosilyticum sp.]|nr:hypothetical protein [Cellulosilyticum sp.]
HTLSDSFGLWLVASLTQCMFASYVISVRQTRALSPASFRFHLTMDTLALNYVLGTINPHSGLSPVRLRPCWAHAKNRLATQAGSYLLVFYFSSYILI